MVNNSPIFRKSAEFLGAICGGLLISLPAIPQSLAQQSPSQVNPSNSQVNRSTGQVNPCPRIFYEEPHNSRVIVPAGCPANALTQRLAAQGLLPVPTTPSQEQIRMGVGGEAPVQNTSPAVNSNPSIGNEPSYNRGNTSQPSTSSEPGAIPTTPGSVTPGTSSIPQQPPQTPNATIALTNNTVNITLRNDTATDVTYQVIGDTAPRLLRGKSDVTLQRLTVPVTVTFQRGDGGQVTVTPQTSSQAGNLEVTFNETADAAQGRSSLRIEPNGSVFFN